MEDQGITSELNENNRTSEIDDAAEPSDDGEEDVKIGDENIYLQWVHLPTH